MWKYGSFVIVYGYNRYSVILFWWPKNLEYALQFGNANLYGFSSNLNIVSETPPDPPPPPVSSQQPHNITGIKHSVTGSFAQPAVIPTRIAQTSQPSLGTSDIQGVPPPAVMPTGTPSMVPPPVGVRPPLSGLLPTASSTTPQPVPPPMQMPIPGGNLISPANSHAPRPVPPPMANGSGIGRPSSGNGSAMTSQPQIGSLAGMSNPSPQGVGQKIPTLGSMPNPLPQGVGQKIPSLGGMSNPSPQGVGQKIPSLMSLKTFPASGRPSSQQSPGNNLPYPSPVNGPSPPVVDQPHQNFMGRYSMVCLHHRKSSALWAIM